MPEMPLSQQLARSQIAIGWPRTLLVLVVVLVIIVVSLQFLIASYERILVGRSKDLDREMQDLQGTIPANDLARLIKLDQQIRNLKLLLDSHVYLSRLLDEIERLTLPQVRYIVLNVDRPNKRIAIRGIAPAMETVGLQAASFSQSPLISAVVLKNAAISSGGGVIFDLELSFVPTAIQSATKQ
jgi:hypothetical protein